MSARQRVELQPGFVLHTHPWRETSLIVELFSRDHGRMPMVAKGARRPASVLRGVLMSFQPLLVDWSGGGEVKTLVRAEWQGGLPLLGGRALLCGYYLNELLIRLLPREDPHQALFGHYGEALRALSSGGDAQRVLRRFELALLQELGYGIDLSVDADSGEPVKAGESYVFIIERGVLRVEGDSGDLPVLSGRTLLALAAGDFSSAETLAQGKVLLRRLINHYLGGQPLQSRRVFTELMEL
ncbi:DNA repair protein RecO [Cognatazoarcus halotolerans]|uniref:DNA repair protein RecO n=1 Tax=Cognatazoarcus halotolerans TaxID=2686016 RepID=UPI001359AAAA|nr:DNA repair protein RecO [Cognatazoarcus halotolerans]MBX3679135.1 DNA repair protein RecO [Rhodocyclaceae bacterium]MCB1898071.1 DNA repair protein RecO [Rhodocyclaceae bacterium]MCP5309237.1 DNA repair protein RecO [Zoogloeaceae bacterium]